MKSWPRLSVASLKAIELAEQEAESSLGSSVRLYTPGSPEFSRTTDNLREGGYRAIDYICAYVEALFDAFAGEYAKTASEITVSREILTQRVAAEVERRAWKAWGGWLFATSIMRPPRVDAGALPGDIQLDAPPGLVRQGIEKVVIRIAEKPSDPKLGPILLQLQDRFRTQLQNLLNARIHHWESRWDERSARVQRLDKAKAQPQDHPPDRRAAVDAYIEEVAKKGKRITRTDIWKKVGYKSRTEFERWERNDPKHPNKIAHERFTGILTEKPHLK